MPIYDSGLLKLCDGRLRTEDGCSFDVHRMVLATKSEYFCAMFCGINEDRREFTIPGISGRCLAEILEYLYTGWISVTEQNIEDLLINGDYLLIEGLHLIIKQSLTKSITVASCLSVFNTANRINDVFVARFTFRFIQTKFEEMKLTQMNDLAELPQEVLEKILSCRSLYVYSENTVWQVIREWAQKDIAMRLHCVPQLLMYLAWQELDENIATEILEHEIVSKNFFMNDLNEIKHSPDFTDNYSTLAHFLEDRSSHFKHTGPYRIPSHLHVVSSYNSNLSKYNLFITYDENIDLWRHLGESAARCDAMFLTVVGHIIYLFGRDNSCQKFDLIAQQWIPMSNFQSEFVGEFYGAEVDGYIYVIGEVFPDHGNSEDMILEVYDAANDRWFEDGSLGAGAVGDDLNICEPISVAINRTIYVVGRTQNLDAMAAQMFDTVTQRWTILSPPRNAYPDLLSLVVYRGKVCAIGYDRGKKRAKVEVLDPGTNLWGVLPDLPRTSPFTEAIVLNDQIVVYDDDLGGTGEPESFRFTDAMERWEVLETRMSRDDLMDHRFSLVSDVDTIRRITKLNRDLGTHLQKKFV